MKGFFLKKDAKTFYPFASRLPGQVLMRSDKSFLVLFFKNEPLSYEASP